MYIRLYGCPKTEYRVFAIFISEYYFIIIVSRFYHLAESVKLIIKFYQSSIHFGSGHFFYRSLTRLRLTLNIQYGMWNGGESCAKGVKCITWNRKPSRWLANRAIKKLWLFCAQIEFHGVIGAWERAFWERKIDRRATHTDIVKQREGAQSDEGKGWQLEKCVYNVHLLKCNRNEIIVLLMFDASHKSYTYRHLADTQEYKGWTWKNWNILSVSLYYIADGKLTASRKKSSEKRDAGAESEKAIDEHLWIDWTQNREWFSICSVQMADIRNGTITTRTASTIDKI